jgi:riboflavin synthase
MFAGITRGLCPVVALSRTGHQLSYEVQLSEPLAAGLEVGASVAIDGVCQTVTRVDDRRASFDAIEETLRVTTLGELEVGASVSVERSLTFGAEVGGHIVAGHVWGTALVDAVEASGPEGTTRLWLSVPAEWMKFVQPKGFIAVDGSSLTVGQTEASGRFCLHLIPETLRLTRLGQKPVGARVNIELDPQTVAIVRAVERVLADRDNESTRK